MNVKSLRDILTSLGDAIPPADLARLDTALRALDELSIAELCDRLVAGRKKAKQSPRSKAPNHEAVTRYLDELGESEQNVETFKAVLDRAKADRTIKVREATLIAQKYLGTDAEIKTKPAALKAIAARQFADRRREARKRKVSGLF